MADWTDNFPAYDSPFYDPEDEHPIAKLYRRDYNAELMRLAVIDRLLASVGPKDVKVQLFTFAERQQWGLRVNARRTVGD